jgi:hypothetical protein
LLDFQTISGHRPLRPSAPYILNLIKSSFFYDYRLFSKTFRPRARRRDTADAPLERGFSQVPPLFFKGQPGAAGRLWLVILTYRILTYYVHIANAIAIKALSSLRWLALQGGKALRAA